MEMKILDSIMCLIEQSMCFLFFNALCEKRFKSRIIFIIAIIVSAVILFLCSGISVGVRPVFSFLQVIIISSILYKDSFWVKSAYSIMVLYIFSIIDIIMGNFAMIAFDEQFLNTFYFPLFYRICYYVLIKIVNALTIYLIYKGLRKIKNDVSIKFWLLYNAVMFVFLLITTVFIVIYSYSQVENTSLLFLIISISFFAMSMVVIYFFTEICYGFQRDKKLYILETGYRALQEKMALQNQNSENLKKVQHDMKKHLLNAAALVEKGKFETAAMLLKDAGENVHKNDSFMSVDSGSDIVDAIIVSKSAVCEKCNIVFKFKIECLDKIQIDVLDLSSLLSNMLDNAIDAAARTDEPSVELNIFPYNAYWAICVKNSYKGGNVLMRTSDCLASTKLDSSSHGFGSRIIKDISLKYDGESTWEADGHFFNTVVLIKV